MLRPEQRVGRRVGDEQAEAHEATSDTTWFGVSASGRRIHRVAADGISPDQAVDEAIARIKEILTE
jgi:hypothetical protein